MLACSVESKLRTEGPTPYVRCIAGPEPEGRTVRSGDWTFQLDERVLDVKGPRRALRVGVVSSPGLGGAPSAAALARVREVNADLLVLLGGIGEAASLASATLEALASLSTPSLVVLGGRDTWAAREKAFEALTAERREHIFDASVLRALRVANNTFVPLPGAEKGRYALNAAACGFDQADLDTAARELGAARAGERRWLLSWQAPSRVAGIEGPKSEFGAALGSPLVSKFAERVGAKGGLYAWPVDEAASIHAGPLGIVAVPRLYGPALETSAGARLAAGILVLEVGTDGVRVVL